MKSNVEQLTVTVWQFLDGRAGHAKQSMGLIQGLTSLFEVKCVDIDIREGQVLRRLLQCNYEAPPDLLVGAGHRTHPWILLCRSIFGGKSVILMKPSLPTVLFDMVIVPKHDRCYGLGNVYRNRLVLSPITKGERKQDLGLILLGGPSRHHDWPEEFVLGAITRIATDNPTIQWHVYDSRRTPSDFLSRICEFSNVSIRRHDEIATDTLVHDLAEATYAWITSDSVSMVHEALANELTVGAIDVPLKTSRKQNKIVMSLAQFKESGAVAAFPHRLSEKSKESVREVFSNPNIVYASKIKATLLNVL